MIISICIVLAFVAASALLYVMENTGTEISTLKTYEENVMEVLLS